MNSTKQTNLTENYHANERLNYRQVSNQYYKINDVIVKDLWFKKHPDEKYGIVKNN